MAKKTAKQMEQRSKIQVLIDQAGGAPAFIEMTGIPKRTVYRWKTGESCPPDWTLDLISDRIKAMK
jgi:hypothetical protein